MKKLDELAKYCALGVHRFPIPRRPAINDLRSASKIGDLCNHLSPDIVHGHTAKGAAYARLVANRIGAKSVCTLHGGSLHYSYNTFTGSTYLLLERILKHRTDGMVFESAYAKATYIAKLGPITFPHRVILNGLYANEFEPVDNSGSSYDFVFVGEFRRLKGIFTLVDAVQELSRCYDVKILMAGSGPDEAKLRSKIDDLELTDSISVVGPIYPSRSAFSLGKFVVAPSIKESMPYLVLEAIAAKMPLVTTNVGGIPEIYGEYSEQLLEPDHPGVLAAALARFLQDPEEAYRKAGQLSQRAQTHLRVEEMQTALTILYDEVIGKT